MQSSFRKWMLPEGVVEALPSEARKLHHLENEIISLASTWGYQMLRPPMIEYADTFISEDQGEDLAEQTIQFKDQKSGRQLGLRADITPQVARIDAHYLKNDCIARYAYVGEVVRSYPTGHGSIRNPSVAGVELLGSQHIQADIEVVSLLISYLNRINLNGFIIALGNVDIASALLEALALPEDQHRLFFEAWSKKDNESLIQLSQAAGLREEQQNYLTELTRGYGSPSVLDTAAASFADFPSVLAEIKKLSTITQHLQARHNDITFHIDLSDVYGYGYHNGLIFAAYTAGQWQSIARGGRYDSFGNDFIESSQADTDDADDTANTKTVSQIVTQIVNEEKYVRPSIGFSCHLNLLANIISEPQIASAPIWCDLTQLKDTPELHKFVRQCRDDGRSVIYNFDDKNSSINRAESKIVTDTLGNFFVEKTPVNKT